MLQSVKRSGMRSAGPTLNWFPFEREHDALRKPEATGERQAAATTARLCIQEHEECRRASHLHDRPPLALASLSQATVSAFALRSRPGLWPLCRVTEPTEEAEAERRKGTLLAAPVMCRSMSCWQWLTGSDTLFSCRADCAVSRHRGLKVERVMEHLSAKFS